MKPDPKKVFVVHGRNEHLRRSLFAFLRAVGLDPIEWSDAVRLTRKAAPYIGEILEAAFNEAQAVVVLLTPDDEAKLKEELLNSNDHDYERYLTGQARPNVLFEAGMAFARHAERTILIEVGKLRPFSDVAGRHTVKLNNSPQKRMELAQRLETAGCDISTEGKSDWLKEGDFEVPPPKQDTSTQGKKEKFDTILQYTENCIRDVDWRRCFGKTGRFEMLVSYSTGIIRPNRAELEELAHRSGVKIRIFLADWQNNQLVEDLARRFYTDAPTIRNRIRDAVTQYSQIFGETAIRLTSRAVPYSVYLFDSVVVVSMQSVRPGRPPLATFVGERGGDLYSYFEEEVRFLGGEKVSKPLRSD